MRCPFLWLAYNQKMGNMCSKPQPPEPVPAPKSGEPGVSQELAQLRSQIDMARHTLKDGNEKMCTAERKLAVIRKALDSNREVVEKVKLGLGPIEEEIQRRVAEDSEGENAVCRERKEEIQALKDTADTFRPQETPASQLHAEVKTVKKSSKKLLLSLDELGAKAVPFPEEQSQVKDEKPSATQLRTALIDLKRKTDNARTTAIAQQSEMTPIQEKLDQFLSGGEEVVFEEMGGNMEVVEEQEVAAEVLTDFNIEDLFFEETYSRWLWERSLLRKALGRFNTPEYGAADVRTVVETFERIMKETHEANLRDEEANVRPLDLDVFFLISLFGANQDQDPRIFCEFISGVLTHSSSSPYVCIIARILGLHETASTAPSYAATIPVIVSKFEQYFDNTRVSREVRTKIIAESQEQVGVDYVNGGWIGLAAVLNAIFEGYEKVPELAYAWAKNLRPEGTEEDTYLLYLLCNRIKSINSDSNRVWKDLTKSRSIELFDFAQGLRRLFNLHLPEDDAALLFDKIDVKRTGLISRVNFVTEVKLQWYLDLSATGEFTVAKAKVMEAYLKYGVTYMRTMVWETYMISKGFQSRDLEFHSSDFSTICEAFEESNSSPLLAEVQESGNCVGSDTFGFDELAYTGLRRPFGSLGKIALWRPVAWEQGSWSDPVRALLEEVNAA